MLAKLIIAGFIIWANISSANMSSDNIPANIGSNINEANVMAPQIQAAKPKFLVNIFRNSQCSIKLSVFGLGPKGWRLNSFY